MLSQKLLCWILFFFFSFTLSNYCFREKEEPSYYKLIRSKTIVFWKLMVMKPIVLSFWSLFSAVILRKTKTLLYALDDEPMKTFGSGQRRIMSVHKTIDCAASMFALVSTPLKFAEYRNHSLHELRLWCNWAGSRTMQCIYLRCYHKSIVGSLGGRRGVKAQNSNL